MSVCVAASDGKCACDKKTHEQTRAAPVNILYIFLGEGNKQQPGERD